jgi:hypothetical protein
MQEQLQSKEREEVVHDILEEIEHRKEPALSRADGNGSPPKAQ